MIRNYLAGGYFWHSAALEMETQFRIELVDDASVFCLPDCFVPGTRRQVVEFQWFKRGILKQFPLAFADGFNRLASVSNPAFASSKQPLTARRWLVLP
ncbi:MAG: hypothetical protein R3C20_15710 [Planctomycetaceae bacterium]